MVNERRARFEEDQVAKPRSLASTFYSFSSCVSFITRIFHPPFHQGEQAGWRAGSKMTEGRSQGEEGQGGKGGCGGE